MTGIRVVPLGGEGFVLMAAGVASIQPAVAAGAKVAGEDGMLLVRGVIAALSPDLFRDYIQLTRSASSFFAALFPQARGNICPRSAQPPH
jgi:hypothetical protein